jgi:hypothetical protein
LKFGMTGRLCAAGDNNNSSKTAFIS